MKPTIVRAIFSVSCLAALLGAPDARAAAGVEPAFSNAEIQDQYETILDDIHRRAAIAAHSSETFREDALILASDRDPLVVVLRRTAALLADLKKTGAADSLAPLEKQLAELRKKNTDTALADTGARCSLFNAACILRRQIAFANPLLNFNKLLFIKRHRAIYEHMCDQFYGIAANPGGGLYILENPFGATPTVRDVLADATVENGRMKGQKLQGGPAQHAPLSYNGYNQIGRAHV